MVVYVGFRRGNWMYRALRILLFEGMVPLLRKCTFGPDVWLSTTLFFQQPCTGYGCMLCSKRLDSLPRHLPGTPHAIMLTSTVEHGVAVYIDIPLDKKDAWAFLKVGSGDDDTAMRFFHSVSDKAYNMQGVVMAQLGFGARGVQRDNVTVAVNSLFCVELVVAFLQKHCHGYDYGMTPCKATAGELFHSMMTKSRAVPAVYVYKDDDGAFTMAHLHPLPRDHSIV